MLRVVESVDKIPHIKKRPNWPYFLPLSENTAIWPNFCARNGRGIEKNQTRDSQSLQLETC